MKIRRFTAGDLESAIRLARHALGPDTVILETRGGDASPAGTGVTVVAAIDRHLSETESRDASDAEGAADRSGEGPGEDPRLERPPAPQGALQRVGRQSPRLGIAVTSGKGGVGKTSLATNLALVLARMGRRVLLVDGDFGLANVDLMLGLSPRYNLCDVVSGRRRIDEALLSGPDGIRILPAASGVAEMVDLDDYRRELLLQALQTVTRGRDVLIVDTGSGIHRQTLRLAQLASEILVVTTPEPPAFSDAYATIKALSLRRLTSKPRLVINRVRDVYEAELVAEKVGRLTQQFLGFAPELCGMIPEDEIVRAAIRAQKPFATAYPDAPASRAVRAIARRLITATSDSPDTPVSSAPPQQSLAA